MKTNQAAGYTFPSRSGWLTELIRKEAHRTNSGIIKWPSKRSVVIAVSNLKGGVYVSTIAAALAIIAARKFSLKVRHFHCSNNPVIDYYQEAMAAQGVETTAVTHAQMLDIVPSENEIVIVDVSRSAAIEAMSGTLTPFWSNFAPDILLVPADFESVLDVGPTSKFLNIPYHRSAIRLLHRSSFMGYDFIEICRAHGLSPGGEQWVPFIMSRSDDAEFMPTDAWGRTWNDARQEAEFTRLFSYVIDQVGGEVLEFADRQSAVDVMMLHELLDLVEDTRSL